MRWFVKQSVRNYGMTVTSGGAATVYKCPCCPFHIKIQRMRNPGRGFGLRTGGGAYSTMCAHIRAEHPEQPK